MFEKMFNRETGYFDLYHDDRFRGTLSVAEELAQQIVTSLNAWQEIQNAMSAYRYSNMEDIDFVEMVARICNEYDPETDMPPSDFIPKNVHSTRERLKESGEGGYQLQSKCPHCGEYHVQWEPC